jgi:poly(beta-D-mannuronate) lyase
VCSSDEFHRMSSMKTTRIDVSSHVDFRNFFTVKFHLRVNRLNPFNFLSHHMKYILLLYILILSNTASASTLVRDVKELKIAVEKAKPGDTVFLQDKVWKDAAISLYGKGTSSRPIFILPQSKGGVVFSGKSYVNIGGTYLVFKGFHFKDGYTPESAVITFRIDNDVLANYCRVSECVIENYSQPKRFDSDNWIVLWGKQNRIDHCTFVNKLNAGPTIIADLNDERSQQNYHSIDSNYFKGRERFGSNGGETIRIGVSRYSLTASHTQISYNYFERCNGEVEIISIKSGENKVNSNTFFECEGGLVMRHGSKNVIEGNLFLGNNKSFTGGVRLINPGHHVFNNVFKDLKGTAFRSALSVLNGVPNSLINRYYQVKDANINNNTFINCTQILFGAGKDAERTLSPQNVTFNHNLIVNSRGNLYQDDNKDGGIRFQNNGVSLAKQSLPPGFMRVQTSNLLKGTLNLPYHTSLGANLKAINFVDKDDTGASWYQPQVSTTGRLAKVFKIKADESESLPVLIQNMIAGDTLMLTDAGVYKVKSETIISQPITIMASKGLKSKPSLVSINFKSIPAFFTIANGGKLTVDGLVFKGAHESYGDVQTGIRSTSEPMNQHYSLRVNNCEFYDYNESTFNAFRGSKSTMADSIVITNSLFRNMSGTAINLGEEKEDKGIYDAEYIFIQNCIFSGVLGSAINVYRGGNDESTLGPFVTIDHCTFNEVENREQGTVVKLIGAQYAKITNSIFVNSGQGGRAIEFREYRWDNIKVDYCNFYRAGRVESFYNKANGLNIYHFKPEFRDVKNNDFRLKSLPTARSSDGKPLGAN